MALAAELIAASGGTLVPLLIGILGSGGLLGAVVALVKLRGDNNSASVAQAQGANETLVDTLAAIERERDYWKNKWDVTHKEKNELYARLLRIQHAYPEIDTDI